MVESIDKLVRPNIKELKPYRSARDDFSEGILLDANENSYGSPFETDLQLNRYPDPYQHKLRGLIAGYRDVKPEQVFTGVGSDEAIDLLIRIFCEPGVDHIITTPPTYGMYKVSASVNNVAVKKVQLTPDFQPDVDGIIEQLSSRSKILFLCSPNNPTANLFNKKVVERLIHSFPGIVVVDEAYIDFATQQSLAGLTSTHSNLVVTQTLSKAFGLAGIRLGIAIAPADIITYLMKIKAPYNVNSLTAQTAAKAFDHIENMEANVARIREQREWLEDQLNAMNCVENVFPSDANFLLFRIDDALNVYKTLAKQGIIIRYRGNEPLCENCLRVTVGTPEQNKRFINVLRKIAE